MSAARADERGGFEDAVRIRLLETDMDEVETDVNGIKTRIDKLTWAIVGAALTLTTSSVLLAINLAVTAGAP